MFHIAPCKEALEPTQTLTTPEFDAGHHDVVIHSRESRYGDVAHRSFYKDERAAPCWSKLQGIESAERAFCLRPVKDT
jgi:hypothetical protein